MILYLEDFIIRHINCENNYRICRYYLGQEPLIQSVGTCSGIGLLVNNYNGSVSVVIFENCWV